MIAEKKNTWRCYYWPHASAYLGSVNTGNMQALLHRHLHAPVVLAQRNLQIMRRRNAAKLAALRVFKRAEQTNR